MTSEDDFWKVIEADRTDRLTFAVFADWLDDRGDPRGPVVRMLGVRGRRPIAVAEPIHRREDFKFHWFSVPLMTSLSFTIPMMEQAKSFQCVLPEPWFKQLDRQQRRSVCPAGFYTEAAALEAAIAAFLKMDPSQQQFTMARELKRAAERDHKESRRAKYK